MYRLERRLVVGREVDAAVSPPLATAEAANQPANAVSRRHQNRAGPCQDKRMARERGRDDRAVLLTSPDAQFSNPHSPARHRHPTPARGFLPRGFSDACRPSLWLRPSAAGIPRSLNESGRIGDGRHLARSHIPRARRRSGARSRRHSRKPWSLLRGTEGSNPSPSSGESTANLTSSMGRSAEGDAVVVCVSTPLPMI
jgi:hypothetical protein